ncbi:MAG TPA: 16S rRNA (guanine(527)-N(7))-methyltransferase RsmG [Caulobacteraceae bacterium]
MSFATPVAPREIPPLPDALGETLGVFGESARALERFGRLLAHANASMNLVGAASLDEFWTRHVLDCAQLLRLAPQARTWADLGSGAGLPGLVLAILLKERPEVRVHLVESAAKRCRFLDQVVAELGLPAEIHHRRAEGMALRVEVVTARACAPLDRLLGFAGGFLREGARGLFLKGAGVQAEISQARKRWRFDCETFESLSDPRGRVLSVTGVCRAP